MEKVQFTVGGLTCEACTKIVKNRLTKSISGVREVQVEQSGDVSVVSDSKVTEEAVKSALADTDFKFISFK